MERLHQVRVFVGHSLIIVVDQQTIHGMAGIATAHQVQKLLKSRNNLLERLFINRSCCYVRVKMSFVHTLSKEPSKTPLRYTIRYPLNEL